MDFFQPMAIEKMAVAMTAYRRPYYFGAVLEAWKAVRGVERLADFRVALDPSDRVAEMLETALPFMDLSLPRHLTSFRVAVNPGRLGVLVNPVEAISTVFRDNQQAEFVILAEEDILVSDDVLEYFSWAAGEFGPDADVAIVCAMPRFHGDDPHIVRKYPYFSGNLIWGTWRHTWEGLIEPTWDRSYSTGNAEQPGAGWDYHLDWRILPQAALCSVAPDMSRSQHIGEQESTHCQPAQFHLTQVASFREHFDPGTFRRGPSHGPARTQPPGGANG